MRSLWTHIYKRMEISFKFPFQKLRITMGTEYVLFSYFNL